MSSKKNDEIYKDDRFAHLINNPRFKKLPQREGKIKIDDRFKKLMFKDKKFKVKYSVDKYGRQVNSSTTEDLKKYYDQSSEESSEEEIEEEESENGNSKIENGHELPDTVKEKLKNLEVDYIRGEGVLQTDSSDEDSSDEDEEIFIEHVWGELDHDAETTEDSSRRIACMHMDWDRIRAVDIMMMLNSFIPPGTGSILSVKIYPSEFGKERMSQEELKGPEELTRKREETKTNDEPVDEEDEAYKEKLREYQLNRLKYYYAVIEFDSIKTADIVYKECDGLEYESTANRLDLRFIPDQMEFDNLPKESCSELPERAKYQPRIFFTTALQQAKVELTWDETDVSRKEITEKLFSDKKSEITDQDLRKFVAVSSSENEESDEEDDDKSVASDEDGDVKPKNRLNLYKSLLQEINQKEDDKKKKQVEMEFSWGVGSTKKDSEGDESNQESAQEELTPYEKILHKKKLKQKARKLARKNRSKGADEDDKDEEKGYSSSDFDEIDMNDPYFAEEFANDEYKMPKKKLSKTQKKKQKKLAHSDDENEDKLTAQNELELLLNDGSDEKAHFSLKKIQENETMSSSKRKRRLKKSKKEITKEQPVDNFELNIKDDRFSAVYTKSDFNIDPTDSNFKKTKGMDVLIQEKLKRRYNNEIKPETENGPAEKKLKVKDAALSLLVKSLKRKAVQ